MSSVPGCKRPLSSVPAGTRGCSSSWCSRTSRGRVGTGPRGFLGLCSPHLPRAPSLLRAPVEHLPSRWHFAGLVRLPADSELLQSRTRLLPPGCRAQPGRPEPEAGRATESSTPRSTSMKREPGTSPPPRPYHCCPDSVRCRTVRGSFATEQALGPHCKRQPSDGTRAAAQGLSRPFRGCPRALDAGSLPPARNRRTRQPLPAHSRPLGPGQDQVSPSNSRRPASSAALIGRTPGGSGVVTSGPRRQQRKPWAAILGP